MTTDCNCDCDDESPVIPRALSNRPGLKALSYRIGTHASFLEAMKTRAADAGPDGQAPLARLDLRNADDPAVGLLDAWALVADVITFYQERIANEGYLRTARESMSVQALAALTGFVPNPGLAASVHLAYDVQDQDAKGVLIPAGSRVQSTPDAGGLPQTFETAADLVAHQALNRLSIRRAQPQTVASLDAGVLYLAGTATDLKPNDLLLFVGSDDTVLLGGPRRVASADTDFAAQRTKVTLQPSTAGVPRAAEVPVPQAPAKTVIQTWRDVATALAARRRPRIDSTVGPAPALAKRADARVQAATASDPVLRGALVTALNNVPAAVTPGTDFRVFAFRVRAPLFGNNAPLRPVMVDGKPAGHQEWTLERTDATKREPDGPRLFEVDGAANAPESTSDDTEVPDRIWLDAAYDKIVPGGWVIVDRPADDPALPGGRQQIVTTAAAVDLMSRADYGLTGRSTCIRLEENWLASVAATKFAVIRGASVYAQSELLQRADLPSDLAIGGSGIVLDGVVDVPGGRKLIISGEVADQAGVQFAELLTVASAQSSMDAGEPYRTHLTLSAGLSQSYKPGTVALYGNVVDATQGETRMETLGSGDASQASLALPIRQGPLTLVSAPTSRGYESTLQVRVNDVLWHETDSFLGLGPTDRRYMTRPLGGGRVQVAFGNGVQGARPATGAANIQATYRTGLGVVGNVPATKINQAVSRPLGVSAVTNPMRAEGGGDPHSPDEARHDAPLAAMALDRLVSTNDYADFARAFAGIGKAVASRLATASRETVCVSLTAADEQPLSASADVLANLATSLAIDGDPYQPVVLLPAQPMFPVIAAGVRVLADHQWAVVEPTIRAALMGAFGFAQRDFGQDLVLSDVISTIQRIPGVDYVDIDVFEVGSMPPTPPAGTVPAAVSAPPRARKRPRREDRIRALPARLGTRQGGSRPVLAARIVYLSSAPDNLVLKEIKT